MSGMFLLFGGLGALALAVVVVAVGFTAGSPAQAGVARALTGIEGYRQGDKPGADDGRQGDLLAGSPGWLRTLGRRLSPSGLVNGMDRRLDLAGNPAGWTADRIFGVKGLGLVVLGTLGAALGMKSIVSLLLYAVIGGAVGFFLPDVLLLNVGMKRQEAIRKLMADGLDMLTVCVEAGLGFDGALAQVARNTTGPLAAEFSRVLQEMQIGKSRTQALRGMTERTSVPELRVFVSALVQAGELGVPISRVLREQAKEMRLRRRQRAEEQAQKVPVKIMFPLIACLFPALFVVIIGPGAISMSGTLF